MSKIRLLSKNISSKIAAGEVVERPLSVVKELVENAIDAGASAISIDITDGGIKEICVTDNGTGIDSSDVKLAFEKHATSKINTESDLNYINTQGFRGEALSSIAAIAVVEMRTKTKDEELGTHMRISGGRIDYINPSGLPGGTAVCVSNLFFNVPARLKFLKRAAQEAAYVSDLVSRYILDFPEISFHYRSQGKTIYQSPGNGDLKSAIYCVYGRDIMDNITYVTHMTGDIEVSGYVSRPGKTMKNRRAGSVFVNSRYVRSTALHDMVKSAYGETLVKGEFPFFALNIKLPASAVDVNVHPNKLQVRFKEPASVEYVIKEAVSQACNKIQGNVQLLDEKVLETPISNIEMRATMDIKQDDFFSGFKPSVLKEETQTFCDNEHSQPINTDLIPTRECRFIPSAVGEEPLTSSLESKSERTIKPPISYRLIGSFSNTYVLVEQADNLLLIDQHAAHERLLYNTFINTSTSASQALLAPMIVTVSHEQKNTIDENIDLFCELGFDIQPFGTLEYKISAVPSQVNSVSVHDLIQDALYEISRNKGNAVIRRDSIIRAACRSAVKAGDALRDRELKELIEEFLEKDVIPTCPHGRPIISVITKKQIEKSFKRII